MQFHFFLISGRGQLWREVVRKENEVSGHPTLPFPRILIPSPLFQNPTAGDHGGAGLQGVSDQNFDSSPKFWNVCKTFRARHPLSHFHWQVWEGKLGCKGGSCLGDFDLVVRKAQSNSLIEISRSSAPFVGKCSSRTFRTFINSSASE